MPGRTGTVAGLFFGFAFGMGGVGAAVLGKFADHGIDFVYQMCAFLPLIGLLAAFLPDVDATGAVKRLGPDLRAIATTGSRRWPSSGAASAPGRSGESPA